jgi:fructokinase
MTAMRKKILCIGEILWDSMPSGLFLGGAPFNVAYHLNNLGGEIFIISRVGDDDLGKEAVKRAAHAGVSTELIQTDDILPTGFVEVELGANGIPEYNIKKPAAWDKITPETDVINHAKSADAIVFGTLAQRTETTRNTIMQIGKADCLKVLDLNFRFPHVTRHIAEQSLKMADMVKMNHEELEHLQAWFGLSGDFKEAVFQISETFSISTICVTKGAEGAVLWADGEFSERKGCNVTVADTVGSGDAFLAVIVSGTLAGLPPEKLLDYSNRLGAFVATQQGATPVYSLDSIDAIVSLPLK